MLLDIFQLPLRERAGGHVLVLDAVIGQDGGGQAMAQVHALQPLRVHRRDGVIALPKGFQLPIGHGAELFRQDLRLRQQRRQVPDGKAVRIHTHFFRGRDDDAHIRSPFRRFLPL